MFAKVITSIGGRVLLLGLSALATFALLSVWSPFKGREAVAEPKKTYSDIKTTEHQEVLVPFSSDSVIEVGSSIGFKTLAGEVKIPIGKYAYFFTDTLKTYAMVLEKVGEKANVRAIDSEGKVVFDVYLFDNGPDYLSDGLFRVKRNGKVGYANSLGELVIACKYECASPFEDGKAKVALDCQTKQGEDEHTYETSKQWLVIDKKGIVVQQ